METWIILRFGGLRIACVLKLWVVTFIVTIVLYITIPTRYEQSVPRLRRLGASNPIPRDYNESGERSRVDQPSWWIVVDMKGTLCCQLSSELLDTVAPWRVVLVTRDDQPLVWCRRPACFQLTPNHCRHELKSWSTSNFTNCPSPMSGYLFAMSKKASKILDADCAMVAPDAWPLLSLWGRDARLSGLSNNDSAALDPFDVIRFFSSHNSNCSRKNYQQSTQSYLRPSTFYIKDYNHMDLIQVVPFPAQEYPGILNKYVLRSLIVPPTATLSIIMQGTTFFSESSLFMTFAPIEVPVWVSTIFRTFWVHVIKQQFDTFSVGYLPLGIYNDDKCPPSQDMEFIKQAIRNVEIVKCILKIKCQETERFHLCLVTLALEVLHCLRSITPNMDESELRKQFVAWVDDYSLVYGEFLDVFSTKKLQKFCKTEPRTLSKTEPRGMSRKDVVVQLGNNLLLSVNSNSSAKNVVRSHHVLMKHLCPRIDIHNEKLLTPRSALFISDVALIITVVNETLEVSLPYLEYLYRKHFAHIVYCGGSYRRLREAVAATKFHHITYVSGPSNDHQHLYTCLAQVMKLTLPVSGYLVIHELVLLNIWKLRSLPRHHWWLPRGFSKRNGYKTLSSKLWEAWNSRSDRSSMIHFLNELNDDSTKATDDLQVEPMRRFAERFLETYFRNLQTEYVMSKQVNLLYVPNSFRGDFIIAAEKLIHANASADIAIPVMHFGLALSAEVTYLPGSSLDGENGKKPWNYFGHYDSYFVYPFYPSVNLRQTKGRKFFCEDFMSYLVP